MIDLPPPPPSSPTQISHECTIAVSAYYNLPPELVAAIRIQEGGTAGRVSVNTNGTWDMGPLQVNTIHLRMFASHGISGEQIIRDECTNYFAGGFILKTELVRAGRDVWKGVGNYHSRTPSKHWKYRSLVSQRLVRLKSKYAAYLAWLREQTTRVRASYIEEGIVPGGPS